MAMVSEAFTEYAANEQPSKAQFWCLSRNK